MLAVVGQSHLRRLLQHCRRKIKKYTKMGGEGRGGREREGERGREGGGKGERLEDRRGGYFQWSPHDFGRPH